MKYKAVMVYFLIATMIISSFPMMDQINVEGIDGNFGGGSGSVEDPFIIEDVDDLQNMKENLSAHYILGNDIDASSTDTWNNGKGFFPVGEIIYEGGEYGKNPIEHPFYGSLDGNGHTITGLYIDRPSNFSVGLFGYAGPEASIEDVQLVDCTITGNISVGGIAGSFEGTLSECHYAGDVIGAIYVGGMVGSNDGGSIFNCDTDIEVHTISGGSHSEVMIIGGLVGTNNGIIVGSVSKGHVDGEVSVGGLVGHNEEGTVSNSSSYAYVTGDAATGGLIGLNEGDVSDCSASGNVESDGSGSCGGLIGANEKGSVSRCHAVGDINGEEAIGGLIGFNTGPVENCYSLGNGNGDTLIGGLIGANAGPINLCYSTGTVASNDETVGGLIGHNQGEISISYSTGSVIGADKNVGGLVGINLGDVANCYSLSSVETSGDGAGGLIGFHLNGKVSYCYSAGSVVGTGEYMGGLIGVTLNISGEEAVEHCYWDTDKSGLDVSAEGEGRSTADMMSRSTYEFWDFLRIWSIFEGAAYPFLQAFLPEASILSPRNSGTLVKGDALSFFGSSVVNPAIGYSWNFGDDRTSQVPDPGLVSFTSIGSEEVTYRFQMKGEDIDEGDARTYEVVDDSLQYPDLRTTDIDLPDVLVVGGSVSVNYTVSNIGDSSITGSVWTDSIYLSTDPFLDTTDVLLSSSEIEEEVPVDGSYDGSIDVTIPPVTNGLYYIILSSNDDWSFVERHRLNNELEEIADIDITELIEDVLHSASYPSGSFEHFFRLSAPAGKSLHLSLDGTDGIELMVKHGGLPSRTFYDQISRDGDLVVPSSYAGTWYILVHVEQMNGGGTYSIIYDAVDILISKAAPSKHVTGIPLDLILTGAGFNRPLLVVLTGSDGSAVQSDLVEIHSNTHLTAHFPGNRLKADIYDVRIVRSGEVIASLENVLEVLSEGGSDFKSKLILPYEVRYVAPATIYLEYENRGELSMPAPLLLITAKQEGLPGALLTQYAYYLKNGVWTESMPIGFANTRLYMASGEYPGVLHPGESKRVPIYYAGWHKPWNFDTPPVDWEVHIADPEDENNIDWDSLKDDNKPMDYSNEAWDIIWDSFADMAGDTYGDILRMLNTNARALFWQGQRVDDVDRLMELTIRRAEGFCLIPSLYSHQDILVQSPGDPLTFERHYINHITKRFDSGSLGYGWVHNWEYELSENDDGTVVIKDMAGNYRTFHEDARDENGYLSQPGDTGKLKALASGGYKLTEENGDIQVYNSNRDLEYTEDANSNRITLEYTGDKLVRLSHSSGGYVTFSYNNGGQISSLIDVHGRTTTYTYTDGHLTSVQGYDGYVETFGYDTSGNSPSEHGLTTISLPTESGVTIDYDDLGRLSSIYRGAQKEKVTFSYGYNSVKVTDVFENENSFFFDHEGKISGYKSPLGERYRYIYDDRGRLERLVDPEGMAVQMEYNENDNLISFTDRMGMDSRFAYSGDLGLASHFTDPTGMGVGYDYDEKGNLIKVLYPDETSETWSYDAAGNPVTWKNRRGNVTGYSYNDQGRLTGKVYSNLSEVEYDYDGSGHMTSMEDGSGITEFTRNEDGVVERIDYPGGRWLEFTYDGARRRSSSLDQEGNRLNYQYDPMGRLEVLTDENSDELVRYEYDDAGRMARKTLENGVYTTYEYDEMWRIKDLENFAPDDDVISSFAYSYDMLGRIVEMETHYGTWTYEYDDSGQITVALLESIDPEIPSQNLSYVYDQNGNRIRTIVNGEENDYHLNDYNQYVRVGDHDLTYDADGNLIRDEGPGGNTSYTYDDENRLIGLFRGGDTWGFVYDGLGNRVVTTENGNTSYHVVDPLGLGDLVGTYDESGILDARYIHGSGLIGIQTGIGDRYFHTYDKMGNVQQLTADDGSVVNSYAYLPFGGTILDEETIANPFGFVGEHGVMNDPSGLIYMRARFYDAQLGRFISTDPIGISGGDLNLYRYVRNSPTNDKDPQGLQVPWGKVFNPGNFIPWTNVGNAAGGSVGGAIGAGFDIYGGGKSIALGASIILLPAAGVLGVIAGVGLIAWGAYNIIGGVGTILDFLGSCLSGLGCDPNQKETSAGYGPGNHIREGSLISYRVDFENMKEATGPAQIVTIRDPLPEELDWSEFEFTQVGFGDIMIPLEEGSRYIDKIVEYRYEDDEYNMDFEVHIDGNINMETGMVSVNFYSIDPETELPPEGNVGFLLPEDETGRGKGFFEYLIRPKDGLPTGTEIRNIATIQFDFGLIIDTNQIDPMDRSKGTDPNLEALVTIDAGSPDSQVIPLAENVEQNFTVSWSGQDDTGGSGIGGYDIYVSENEGPWTLWLNDSNQTSATYEGEIDNTYSFYSIATDNVGHREEKIASKEATTTVVVVLAEPTANAGPDQRVDEGTIVTFDGSGSTDNVGIVNYTWTFNDGTRTFLYMVLDRIIITPSPVNTSSH